MRATWVRLVSLSLVPLSALASWACGGDSGGTSPQVVPTSVVVTPSAETIEIGETSQLSVVVTYSDGSTSSSASAVTWASQSASVASVSTSGLVTGVSAGSSVITATAGSASGQSTVTVTEASVASVEISPANPMVEVGLTVQLTATPRDARGNALSGRDVTWSSASETIATVNSGGLVTGVAEGAATITATSEGVEGSVSVTVNPRSVDAVEISPAAPETVVGGTVQLSATARDSDGNVLTGRTVSWASDNEGVATVSGTGLVSGVAAGQAGITATIEGKQASVTVTVTNIPIATIEVAAEGGATSLEALQTLQLSALARDGDGNALSGRTFTWSTSDESVATVDGSGLVTGVAPGAVTITASAEGKSGVAVLTVTPPSVASVELSPALSSATVASRRPLTATLRDAAGNELTDRAVESWEISDESLATVVEEQPLQVILEFLAVGEVTVTATSEGVSGTARVVISPRAVGSVQVAPAEGSVGVGSTIQLAATIFDTNGVEFPGKTATWSSGDEAIATVDAEGLVTGVAPGEVVITATADEVSGTSTLTVTEAEIGSVEVTAAGGANAVEIGSTLQLTAVVKDGGGNEIPGAIVNWSSSNPGIGSVDAAGLVTGNAEGAVTITAESQGAQGTIDLQVTQASFNPGGDTSIGGILNVHDFIVPAGVTVTMTQNLTINATGDFSVAGTLQGACMGLTLNGSGAIDITGTVDNECADATENPPHLKLTGDGVLNVDGGALISSGSIEVKNDPTLSETEFEDIENSGVGMRGSRYDGGFGSTIFPCTVRGFVATRGRTAASGESSTTGDAEDGRDGRNTSFYCSGDLEMSGGSSGATVIEGQYGGNGGSTSNAEDPSQAQTAKPGRGGDGGKIRLRSRGEIKFSGSSGGTVMRLADGGHGGGDTKIGNGPGASATALGADGGDGGSFSILAGGGITISPAGLIIRMGRGGNGGDATAQGTDGLDAGAEPAQNGGSGTATGGKGGNQPDGQLKARGNVTGAANVILAGRPAGNGGIAGATAGDGGDGNEEFPDGAEGGTITATGGNGGDAPTKDLFGNLVAEGGPGGSIFLFGGNGGNGWNDCVAPDFKPGGAGGKGGDGNGVVGVGGSGVGDSPNGGVQVSVAGNGGNGGDGAGPGAGGQGGTDNVDLANDADARTDGPPVFEDGAQGSGCVVVEEKSLSIDLTQMPNTSGLVPQGVHTLPLIDNETSQQFGTIPMATTGDGGNNFYGSSPPRVGVLGPDGWAILTGQATALEGGSLELQELGLCFLNTSGIDSNNPVIVRAEDESGNVISEEPWYPGIFAVGPQATNHDCEENSVGGIMNVLFPPEVLVYRLVIIIAAAQIIDMRNFTLYMLWRIAVGG